jgi:hypothetical protein
MTDDRLLQCTCGATHWMIAAEARGSHIVCYCADCQTFARHLGAEATSLDEAGGTEIFQTLPMHFRLLKGQDNLRMLRLSQKGMYRWYAGCCGTPVANTLTGTGLPFVGAILRPGQSGFGPIIALANTGAARKPVRARGLARAVLGLLQRAAGARLSGRGTMAPFIATDGTPAVAPLVLTSDERNAARPPATR